MYTQYLWPISPIRPISPMQCFYRPIADRKSYNGFKLAPALRATVTFCLMTSRYTIRKIYLIIFIDDLEDGIMNMVYKFADDTKVLAQVHSDAERTKSQEDLDKLTEWAKKWQMSFNTNKCKVMHVGRTNQKFTYLIDGPWIQLTLRKIWVL